MKVLVTGASGNAGIAVCQLLAKHGYTLRMADLVMPPPENRGLGEFVRCDTRTPGDLRAAVDGVDAVVHLAAWHCGHHPPVSDATIFAVNVDGTYHLLEACRDNGIQAFVYASSMAYGWGGVYSVTKVIGEELCRAYREWTGAAVAILRYHAFVPGPYLDFGARLLSNGVDRQDVAEATLAALRATEERRVDLFNTIVHTNHHMPEEVIRDFRTHGVAWCEEQLPGAGRLIETYELHLPGRVEQHDLSEAKRLLDWEPTVGFIEFLQDLCRREEHGLEIHDLVVPGELPRDMIG
jgi:nucleoside-diphosphate-sugar epimerase